MCLQRSNLLARNQREQMKRIKRRKVDECTQSNGKLLFHQNQTDIKIIYSTLSKHYFIVSLTLKFNLLRLPAHIDNAHSVSRMKCHAFCCRNA